MITICLSARNDNYYSNFVKRLEYSVNFFLYSAGKASYLDKFEFNITDWGSDRFINEDFKIHDESFQNKINFFNLEKSFVKKYSHNCPGGFNHDLATNIASRRSNMKYSLIMPADQFMDKWSIFNLINFLKFEEKENNFAEETMFLIPRKSVNKYFIDKKPSFKMMEYYLDNSSFHTMSYMSDGVHTGGGLGGLLYSNKMLERIDGPMYQGLPSHGWRSPSDKDALERVSNFYRHKDLSINGVTLYKQPYSKQDGRFNRIENSYNRSHGLSHDIYDYKLGEFSNWGLKEENIPKSEKKLHVIDRSDEDILNNFIIKKRIKNSVFSNLFNAAMSKSPMNKTLNYDPFELILKNFLLNNFRIFNLAEIETDTFRFPALIKNHNYLNIFFAYEKDVSIKLNRFRHITSNINHIQKGYFNFANSAKFENIDKCIKNLPEEKFGGLLTINITDNVKKNLDFNLINSNSNKISFIILKNNNIENIEIEKKYENLVTYRNIKLYVNKSINDKEVHDKIKDLTKKFLMINKFYYGIYYFLVILFKLLGKINLTYKNLFKKDNLSENG